MLPAHFELTDKLIAQIKPLLPEGAEWLWMDEDGLHVGLCHHFISGIGVQKVVDGELLRCLVQIERSEGDLAFIFAAERVTRMFRDRASGVSK